MENIGLRSDEMMDRSWGRLGMLILALFFLIGMGQPAEGWSYHTHRKIVADALARMPESFQKRFGPFKESFLQGSTYPDSDLKDFQNHVYHVHGGGRMRESATFFREVFESLVGRIKRGEPDAESARWFGLFSHYIADLNQPLHTDGESVDPDEDEYHMKFERDVESQLSKIPLAPIQYQPAIKPVERLMSMVEQANKRYLEIGRAYRGGNKVFDLLPLVNDQYQAAVQSCVDLWLGIMQEAGCPCELLPPPAPSVSSGGPGPAPVFSRMDVSGPGGKPQLVNINTASLQDLQGLPGVGEKKARAILENRPYKSIYDLSKVKGFGVKFLERISDRITIDP
jgi:competence ComEA-like helix-hairpin-helix protein